MRDVTDTSKYIYDQLEVNARYAALTIPRNTEEKKITMSALLKPNAMNYENKSPIEMVEVIKEDIIVEKDENKVYVSISGSCYGHRLKIYKKAIDHLCKEIPLKNLNW